MIQKINFLFGKSRFLCFKDTVAFLTKKNIIYSKIFQSLCCGTKILHKDEINLLKIYTDNVPYSLNDIYDIHEVINDINDNVDDKDKIHLSSNIPINSGLISVVYSGFIDNKEVVIKIMRKNIVSKLIDAFNDISLIVNILDNFKMFKIYNLNAIFLENKQDILNQIDFDNEITNNLTFYKNFKHIESIKVPLIYKDYTALNNNLIVMEKINGSTLFDINEKDKTKFFYIFNKFIFKSILFNKTYHADLHAGNLFFIKKDDHYSIGVIDFGIIGNISKDTQNNLFNLLKYTLIDRNSDITTKLLVEHLIEPKENYNTLCDSDKKFINSCLHDILDNVILKNKHLDMEFIYSTNNLLYNYDLKLSREFSKVQMAIAVGGSVSKYLTTDDDDDTYVNSMRIILDEIIHPKILDY
jgi:predicted unusual protein kinase regulating ubiquinone biosynthesis (AarF/ABC1/UbiB family)